MEQMADNWKNKPKKLALDDRVYIAVSNSEANGGKQYYGTDKLRWVAWVVNGTTNGLEYKNKKYYYKPGEIPDEIKDKLSLDASWTSRTDPEPEPRPTVKPKPEPFYGQPDRGPRERVEPVERYDKVDRVYNSGIPEPNKVTEKLKEMNDGMNRIADELYEIRTFIETMRNQLKTQTEIQQEWLGIKRRRTELENLKWSHKMSRLPVRLNQAQDPADDTPPILSDEEIEEGQV